MLFVCEGDLTREENRAVEQLLSLGKPLVIVMNKADRLDIEEQAALMQRLLERVDRMGGTIERDKVVAVSAGGEIEVVERRDDGTEMVATRKRLPDIGVLVVAINALLEESSGPLDARRDRQYTH